MLTTTSRFSRHAITLLQTAGIILLLGGCGDDESSPATPTGNDLSGTIDELAAVSATFLSATTNSAAMASAATNVIESLTGPAGSPPMSGSPLDTLLASTCPEIIYNTSKDSFTLTLDYGVGCTPEWGEAEISGSVSVTAASLYPGLGFTMTWDEYVVDGVAVDGTVEGTLILNTVTWEIDGTVSEGGASATGTATLSATLEPNAPGNVEDDELIVTGSGSVTSGDVTFTFAIDPNEPLILLTGCDYPIEGDVAVSTELGDARIDFGDGECDSMATVWVGPYSREIDLAATDLSSWLGY